MLNQLQTFSKYSILSNILISSALTTMTFLWTFWIFHQSFLIIPVLIVIGLRLLFSRLILNDYSSSWSKASPKAFLIKTLVGISAFVVYVLFFHGEIRIALLMSELFIYLFSVNFLMYSYQYLLSYKRRDYQKSLVIFGAGEAGCQIASEFNKYSQYQLKAFVDDKQTMQGRSINGIRVFNRHNLTKKYSQIDLVIIALPSASATVIDDIYHFCLEFAKAVKILPTLNQMLLNKPYVEQLRTIDIQDLLARHPTDLDQNFIGEFVAQRTILITGAGGTIGTELANQCLNFGAKQLILLDHSEFALYQLEQHLSHHSNIKFVLLSVVDKQSLNVVFEQYTIDIVIHAAAYKHVPMVEANIKQSIINNIIGTKNIIDLSVEQQVKKFILISTDKAVRPTNVMGATKRVCELYAQNINSKKTQIIAVRFGNVLGSSGSVIPLFEQQIKAGGPITITHPDITRYFMLIDEATQLVLQAGALGKGSEIFILDMGKPVKIVSLAKQMIKLSGARDIEIKFIGLRPGEKLYEELLIDEVDKKTSYPSIMVAQQDNYEINQLNEDITQLINSASPLTMLKNIVSEFDHKPHD